MTATLLKKMSASAIVGNIKEALKTIENDRQKTEIYRVYGMVDGIITGEHAQNGPWIGFTGQVGAVNTITGEEFRSSKVFLPDPMPAMLEGALRENDSVEFALQVDIIRRDDLAIGYEYSVTPLVEASTADPLAHLKEIVKPALEAPKKSTKGAK